MNITSLLLAAALLTRSTVASAQPKVPKKRIAKESQRLQIIFQTIQGLIPLDGSRSPEELYDAGVCYQLSQKVFAAVTATGDTDKADYDKLDEMLTIAEKAVKLAAVATYASAPVPAPAAALPDVPKL